MTFIKSVAVARNRAERNKIFRYLEAYLVRRIICKETAKNYNQLFRSFINNEIDSLKKLKEIIEVKEEKINSMFHVNQTFQIALTFGDHHVSFGK